MIPVLIVPVLNRIDLLARMVASIDFNVKELVVINNGPEQIAFVIPPCVEKLTVISGPNMGVASSWNHGIKLFPADYWLIVNSDIAFAPGDLQRMHEAVAKDGHDTACFYANHGASFFAITPYGVNVVGLFDENFFPAYVEDVDHGFRADLLGAARISIGGCSSIHGDEKTTGSCTIMADPKLRARNHFTHGRNFEYWKRKWGGMPGEETFKTPFNDPSWPIWAWKFDPAFRKGQCH